MQHLACWFAWSAGAVAWVRLIEHTKAVQFVEEEPLQRSVPNANRRGSQLLFFSRSQTALRRQSTLIREQSTGMLLDMDERRASRQPEQNRDPHEMY